MSKIVKGSSSIFHLEIIKTPQSSQRPQESHPIAVKPIGKMFLIILTYLDIRRKDLRKSILKEFSSADKEDRSK